MGKSSKDKRDAYYRLAKEQGWRARSAFKLLQLNEEFNLFDGVTRVVDLCAAPGSWSQVLSRVLIKKDVLPKTLWEDPFVIERLQTHGWIQPGKEEGQKKGGYGVLGEDGAGKVESSKSQTGEGNANSQDVRIVSIDLQPIAPLEGITTIRADITHPSTIPLLLHALDPDTFDPSTYSPTSSSSTATTTTSPVDLVLSDGAPDVTGLHDLDIYVQSQLLWSALSLATRILKPRTGKFVAKIFRAKDVDVLYSQMKVAFDRVTVAKPRSSRASSLEAFVVCEGLKDQAWEKLLMVAGPDGQLGYCAGEGSAPTVELKGPVHTQLDEGTSRLVNEQVRICDVEESEQTEHIQQTPDRWVAPFLACGDLSAFDSEASYKLPDGHVSLDPVQPPVAPPYRRALEMRRGMA